MTVSGKLIADAVARFRMQSAEVQAKDSREVSALMLAIREILGPFDRAIGQFGQEDLVIGIQLRDHANESCGCL